MKHDDFSYLGILSRAIESNTCVGVTEAYSVARRAAVALGMYHAFVGQARARDGLIPREEAWKPNNASGKLEESNQYRRG